MVHTQRFIVLLAGSDRGREAALEAWDEGERVARVAYALARAGILTASQAALSADDCREIARAIWDDFTDGLGEGWRDVAGVKQEHLFDEANVLARLAPFMPRAMLIAAARDVWGDRDFSAPLCNPRDERAFGVFTWLATVSLIGVTLYPTLRASGMHATIGEQKARVNVCDQRGGSFPTPAIYGRYVATHGSAE